ncbi:sensor histidine kinase [Sporosarcina sp. Marseille-Q4063]|uniref:sensor histidine kinase n=1 Tax=Sporosarcina sp. Marseille-Q4063 TaxID=2810514 RepID=UPI001BB06179|nr:sensor histidine kinase [Sporosarcina sp. Marseille-Q4063]QUW22972.1 sensor histidine kinase [Sporosarcina sp. Marseille-Q4063]
MINNLFNNNFKRSDGLYLVFIALLTAIASEIKVIPFNGDAFRFGLGSIAFFLLILIRPPASLIRTGLITGLTVVCFRLFGDMLHQTDLAVSLKTHSPVLLFYFLYALGLNFIKIEQYKTSPLLLGAWAAGFEFIGNSAEQLARLLLLSGVNVTFHEWILLGGVAVLRSYFVVGLYSSIIISEHKKRMQETLSLGSELYAETLYLQKSMDHIEQITASSHDLYRRLKKKELHELSVQALLIAQEIHEVKKDSQRIFAGLSKMTNEKRNENFFLSDLIDLVMTSNKKYSELLKKNITFHELISSDFETNQQIPLLALLNNITANAVESIKNKGEIILELFEEGETTYFIIKDSGDGIPKEDISIIFEPGYTTKFSVQGVAATGIGLSHVQEIIRTLKGQIRIETPGNGTVFRIEIPTENIRK